MSNETNRGPWNGPVVVTGTDTGVGKTVVTAAIGASALVAKQQVAIVKLAQTGSDDDAAEIVRLAGVPAQTLARYPAPLAPLAAARVSGIPSLTLANAVESVTALANSHDVVLVEGAGGLLVPFGAEVPRQNGMSWTLRDLAVKLGAPVVVVTRAGLGTLNHTALTVEALNAYGIEHCVVIGSWPSQPQLVHETNLHDLPGTLAGAVPAQAAMLNPETFRAHAPTWLTPLLYGTAPAWELLGKVPVNSPF